MPRRSSRRSELPEEEVREEAPEALGLLKGIIREHSCLQFMIHGVRPKTFKLESHKVEAHNFKAHNFETHKFEFLKLEAHSKPTNQAIHCGFDDSRSYS